jgi:hypothetical protein
MRTHRWVVVVLLGAALFACTTRAAAPQVILPIGQRLSVGHTTKYVKQIQLDPEINDAGQVAIAVEVGVTAPGQSAGPDEPDDIEALVLYEPKKIARVIAACGEPLPGANQNRTLEEIRRIRISQDGSVIFEATLSGVGAKKKAREEALSLWHWRDGKLHLLLVEDEPVKGAPVGPISSWQAAVANDGRVSAIVKPKKGGSIPSLIVFHDGDVEQSFIAHDADKKGPGMQFDNVLHSAGGNMIVVQSFHPRAGLGMSRLCRIANGQLEKVVAAKDDAPEHITGAVGGNEEIGSIEMARVTGNGRVLVFSKPGAKKNSGVLQAVLASDENFGTLRTLAMMGNKRTYPPKFEFQNLLNEPAYACISDDGYALFTDPANQNRAFFLSSPEGKLDRIASIKDLPGLKDIRRLEVWAMAVGRGGLAAVELVGDHAEHSIFASDAKRGMRRVVGKDFGLPDSRGEMHRFARQKEPRTPMTSDGRYVFAWTGPRSTGGIAVIDLKK